LGLFFRYPHFAAFNAVEAIRKRNERASVPAVGDVMIILVFASFLVDALYMTVVWSVLGVIGFWVVRRMRGRPASGWAIGAYVAFVAALYAYSVGEVIGAWPIADIGVFEVLLSPPGMSEGNIALYIRSAFLALGVGIGLSLIGALALVIADKFRRPISKRVMQSYAALIVILCVYVVADQFHQEAVATQQFHQRLMNKK
jgi:hypothetical protein